MARSDASVIACNGLSAGADDALGGVRLAGITFSRPAGTITTVVGPTGAGKSALVHTIVGLRPAAAGSVRLCGLDPFIEWRAVRRQVCFVPAGAPLLPDRTPLDLVRLLVAASTGRRPSVDETANALQWMEVSDTSMHGPASALLPCERVGVWLAVHRLRAAPVLVMDDPLRDVIGHDRAALMDLLRDAVAAGTTLLLTLRDADAARALAGARVQLIGRSAVVDDASVPPELPDVPLPWLGPSR